MGCRAIGRGRTTTATGVGSVLPSPNGWRHGSPIFNRRDGGVWSSEGTTSPSGGTASTCPVYPSTRPLICSTAASSTGGSPISLISRWAWPYPRLSPSGTGGETAGAVLPRVVLVLPIGRWGWSSPSSAVRGFTTTSGSPFGSVIAGSVVSDVGRCRHVGRVKGGVRNRAPPPFSTVLRCSLSLGRARIITNGGSVASPVT